LLKVVKHGMPLWQEEAVKEKYTNWKEHSRH
jgi:hypothetical protein